MKIVLKIILVLLLFLMAIRAVDGYITVRRELNLFNSDIHRDAQVLGDILRHAIDHIWRAEGPEAALRLVEEANQKGHPVDIRWITEQKFADDPAYDLMSSVQREELIDGDEVSLEHEDHADIGRIFTYVPVDVDGRRIGYLELSEVLQDRDSYVRETVLRELLVGGVVLLVSGIVVVALGVTVVARPLNRLTEKIRQVGSGNLDNPLRMSRRDELGDLADGLDEMCHQLKDGREQVRRETEARLAAVEQLKHVDRLSTIGRLACGVAHELGTPLNVVSGRAVMISDAGLPQEEISKCAKIISRQVERMTGIVRQLLDFARPSTQRTDRIDIDVLLSDTIALLESLGHKNTLIQVADQDARWYVRGNVSQIQQVFTNILDNALQVTPRGGHIRIAVRRVTAQLPVQLGRENNCVAVEIEDEGPGIPEENIAQLFDPFFTTKDVGNGTGLGLSIAWGIVREHDGWIGVRSEIGKGTCFTVYLPLESDIAGKNTDR